MSTLRQLVVVLPSGEYEEALAGAVATMRDWVRAGGTLVAFGEASRWLTREKVGLLATKTELRGGRPEADDEGKVDPVAAGGGTEKEAGRKKDEDAPPGPFDLETAIQPERDRPDAVDPGRVRGLVEFSNVSFSYDGKRPAVADLNLTALPGEIIALVGPTGAGKSTALALLHRVFDPQSGTIKIDGMDIRGLKLGPAYQHFDPTDRKHWPFFAAAQRHGIPVIWHQGPTFPSRAKLPISTPLWLEDIALDFPDLRMIVAHLGHPWERTSSR